MRTAIFTVLDNTKLTIETDGEVLSLVQMGKENAPTALAPGANVVVVSAGVFRVFSQRPVKVTADSQQFELAVTPNNKGDWPDPPKTLSIPVDRTALIKFFNDARSQPAPM